MEYISILSPARGCKLTNVTLSNVGASSCPPADKPYSALLGGTFPASSHSINTELLSFGSVVLSVMLGYDQLYPRPTLGLTTSLI